MRFFLTFLLFSIGIAYSAGASTREKILKQREDKVGSLEQQLQVLEQQLENHVSGKNVIPDGRLSSLKKRIAHYEDQLADISKPLSEGEIADLIAKAADDGEL